MLKRSSWIRGAALFVILAAGGCGGTGTQDEPSVSGSTQTSDAEAPPAGGTAPGTLVGTDGIAAWDALSGSEKRKVETATTLFLHQSVGQDIEDGVEVNGVPFEYFGPDQLSGAGLPKGLNGGIFTDVAGTSNGEPKQKLAVMRKALEAHKGELDVLTFKFGYADIQDAAEDGSSLADTQQAYREFVDQVKAEGVAFVHVTPPLVFSAEENPPKQKFRAWMLETFPNDTIFDLQDIESLDNGKRCETGGVWVICEGNRSTKACPSKSQGIDGPGAGHICLTRAGEFAKAFLYSIHQAVARTPG